MTHSFDEAMFAFRANSMREGFRRSADAFAFEERQIALELEQERRRDERRLANLAKESPCSNA